MQHKARKTGRALGNNSMLIVTVLLLIGGVIEYVFHAPRLAMSPGLATFLGLALVTYLLHEGYFPKEISIPGIGFSVSVKRPQSGSARRKRWEVVRDEVFGLDLSGEAWESGSNDDGYWYRFKSGLQVSRSHFELAQARVWVEFPQPFSSPPSVFINAKGYTLEQGSTTCEGFAVCRPDDNEDVREVFYLAIGACE